MAAYPQVTTYPPLEQISIIPAAQDQITFTLGVRWNVVRPQYPFQFYLCVDDASSTRHHGLWASHPLMRHDSSSSIYQLQEDPESWQATFCTKLDRSALAGSNVQASHLKFTVKYRVSDAAAWQWLSAPQSCGGVQQGEIVMQKVPMRETNISNLVELDSEWRSEKLETQVDHATLFSITSSSLPPTKDMERRTLGSVNDIARFVAFTRLEPPWIGPRHGGSFLHFSEPTMLCSLLRKDGSVVTVAAPSPDDVYMVLETDEQGRLVVASRTDRVTDKPLSVLVSAAGSIEESIEAVMAQARLVANQSRMVGELIPNDIKSVFATPPATAHLDDLVDGLGYCTWNALGQDLDQEKLLRALRDLQKNGINFSTLLIDDGWQDIGPTNLSFDNPFFRGLKNFKAPTEKFPGGLGGLTSAIRAENSHIKDIGVWHALLGYWGALAKEGRIVDEYETLDVDGMMYYNERTKLKVVSPKSVQKFYDDFYAYLAESGITFVKTDVQSLVSDLAEGSIRTDLIPAYQAAWTTAHQKRLSGKAISCMSQVPEMIWRMLIHDRTAPIVLRNSDDFFPEIPASHSWHIWANAHNALVGQHLNAILDWDMFQTSHEYGYIHAAARCLSGGPILLTDVPGDHDVDLIRQLAAPTLDGKSIALRPCSMAKSSHGFDNIDSRVLKIVNETSAGGKLLGVFNVGQTNLSVLVSASDLAAVGKTSWKQDADVVLFSHRTQKIVGPIRLAGSLPFSSTAHSLIQIDLGPRTCDILSGFETNRLSCPKGEVQVAILGLMGKMTGAAAVISSEAKTQGDKGIAVDVRLKALGKLGVWVHGLKLEAGNIKLASKGQSIPGGELIGVEEVFDGKADSYLLHIDMLRVEPLSKFKTDTLGFIDLEILVVL